MVSLLIVSKPSLWPVLFALPGWVQGGLLLVGLAVSAGLSGVLPKYPRIQKFVTALALACVLASALLAAHPTGTVVQAFLLFCDEWYGYLQLGCWF